jgi:hypothetical protein
LPEDAVFVDCASSDSKGAGGGKKTMLSPNIYVTGWQKSKMGKMGWMRVPYSE